MTQRLSRELNLKGKFENDLQMTQFVLKWYVSVCRTWIKGYIVSGVSIERVQVVYVLVCQRGVRRGLLTMDLHNSNERKIESLINCIRGLIVCLGCARNVYRQIFGFSNGNYLQNRLCLGC